MPVPSSLLQILLTMPSPVEHSQVLPPKRSSTTSSPPPRLLRVFRKFSSAALTLNAQPYARQAQPASPFITIPQPETSCIAMTPMEVVVSIIAQSARCLCRHLSVLLMFLLDQFPRDYPKDFFDSLTVFSGYLVTAIPAYRLVPEA